MNKMPFNYRSEDITFTCAECDEEFDNLGLLGTYNRFYRRRIFEIPTNFSILLQRNTRRRPGTMAVKPKRNSIIEAASAHDWRQYLPKWTHLTIDIRYQIDTLTHISLSNFLLLSLSLTHSLFTAKANFVFKEFKTIKCTFTKVDTT